MPTLLREKDVTARKPHVCRTCPNVAIEPGEVYRRSTYAHDGTVYDWVQCSACAEASGWVYAWAGCPDEGVGESEYLEWSRDVGESADVGGDLTAEEQAALAYQKRRLGTIIDHAWIGVAGHPDDKECTYRADGTDDTYCGRHEYDHLWSNA